MIVLGSNTEVLRARLSAAATTTNPTFLFAYGDDNGSPVLGNNAGALDDTTNVDLVGSPNTGEQRAIHSGMIYNGDTAAATIIIEHYDGTTATQVCKIAIAVGGTLTYGANGFAVGGGTVGDMTKAVYDDAGVEEQLVGLTATQTLTNKDLSDDSNTLPAVPYDWIIALGDESTAITTGAAKVTVRAPRAMTLTKVKASLTTAGSTSSAFDVNLNGTSVFSTTLTIDASEKTSETAATAAVLSTTAISADDELTFDIDTAGTSAAGAKITLVGTV
jgi:hypothetical protein